jgi:drug/metabolite transporter (DMT)-like permease
MKKFLTLVLVLLLPLALNAQPYGSPGIDHNVFNICATIFVIGLFMLFIITIMKRIVDFRLKKKIIEKGIPESLVASILQVNPSEDRNINIKWFSLLAGVGVALTIINYTMPLGIHSLAIMAFCIAASFLGYYLFVRYSEK